MINKYYSLSELFDVYNLDPHQRYRKNTLYSLLRKKVIPAEKQQQIYKIKENDITMFLTLYGNYINGYTVSEIEKLTHIEKRVIRKIIKELNIDHKVILKRIYVSERGFIDLKRKYMESINILT